MKHTSGSWEATPGRIVVRKRVENGSMDLICDLRASPLRDDAPYNSLLIAAAPDLLEALKRWLSYAEINPDMKLPVNAIKNTKELIETIDK